MQRPGSGLAIRSSSPHRQVPPPAGDVHARHGVSCQIHLAQSGTGRMIPTRCPCSPTRQAERTGSRRGRGRGLGRRTGRHQAASAQAATRRDMAVSPPPPPTPSAMGSGHPQWSQGAGGGWLYEAVSSQIFLAQSRFQVMAAASAALARRSCRSPARRERRPLRRRQAGPHADNSHKTQDPTPIPPWHPAPGLQPRPPVRRRRQAWRLAACMWMPRSARPSDTIGHLWGSSRPSAQT